MSAHITQLFTLLLAQGDTARLRDAVSQSEEKMRAVGEADLWHYWHGQALLAEGEIDTASKEIGKIGKQDLAATLELMVQRTRAEKAGNPGQLIKFLAARFERTEDPLHHLELCEAFYEAKDWASIVSHAKSLMASLETAPALRLALEAAHRADNPKLCLELLEGREKLFPEGHLPTDLRRVKVQSLQRIGKPDIAISEAEALARETRETVDVLTLVAARLAGGDPKGAAVEARQLLQRNDVSPESHLRLAYAFQLEDQSIAAAHLERAEVKAPDTPATLAAMLELSFRLNREDKVRDLYPKLSQALTPDGPLRLVKLPELLEFAKDNAERQRKAEQLYTEGRLPLHVVLEVVGGTLAEVYDSRFHPDEAGHWPGGAPIFVRHGGRGEVPHQLQITSLHLDISSLLLAAELGILEVLEKTYSPLVLAHSAIATLYHEIHHTQPHQPTQIEEAESIVGLIGRELLHVTEPFDGRQLESQSKRPHADWVALAELAQRNKGYVIDYLPVTIGLEQELAELSDEETKTIAGGQSVLHSLLTAGILGAEQAREAESTFGVLFLTETPRTIAKGTPLFLHGNVVGVLSRAKILLPACEYFRVYIQDGERRRLERLLEFEARRSRLRARLRPILDRVQAGMGAKWHLLPELNRAPEYPLAPEFRCMAELMEAEPGPGVYVCIDDRHLNAFANLGQKVPITTIYDVLWDLRKREAISAEMVFGQLHKMRVANLRYLPVTKEDILFHVRVASIHEGEVVESPELAGLRQYVATCLSEPNRLQLPPFAEKLPNPNGEIAFLMDVLSATRDALRELWTNVSAANLEDVESRADWLLHNLWCDSSALPRILRNQGRDEPSAAIYGSGLAQLYIQGLSLKTNYNDKEAPSPRKYYFTWIRSRFSHDTQSTHAAAAHLRAAFTQIPNRGIPKVDKKLAPLLLGRFYQDLPEELQKALDFSRDALATLGIALHDAINIDQHTFDTGDFWRTAERAARGKRAIAQSVSTKTTFKLRWAYENNQPVIHLSDDAGAKLAISDPSFALLEKEEGTRRDTLIRHSEWFDCDHATFHKEATRISRLPTAADRLGALERSRQRSAVYRYRSLLRRRERNEPLQLSHLDPPPSYSLLAHLRFIGPPAKPLSEALDESAVVLVREYGFAEAFRRLSSFPVRLPAAIGAAFDRLTNEERIKWRERAAHEYLSPVSKVHLIALTARFDGPAAAAIAETVATEQAEKEFEAFQLVLFWTVSQLLFRPEVAKWSAIGVLTAAWLHSTRIYNILAAVSESENILEYFRSVIRPTANDIFRSDVALESEAAHPRQIRHRVFMLHGLTAALVPSQFDAPNLARIRDTLRKLSFRQADEKTIPHMDLALPASWLGNALGSFICDDRAQRLEPWLGAEADMLSTPAMTELLRHSLSRLEASLVQEPLHWHALFHLVGILRSPVDFDSALVRLMSDERLPELVDSDLPSRRHAFFFLAHQSIHYPNARGALIDRFVSIARRLNSSTEPPDTLSDNVTVMLECIHVLSGAKKEAVAAAQEFVRITSLVLDAWPKAAEEFMIVLRGLAGRLPIETNVALWPLFLELRKRARR